MGFILDLLQDLIRGWLVKIHSSPPYSYRFMVHPSLCIYSVGVGFLIMSRGVQVALVKMTNVYNNPFVIGSGMCKKVVTSLCLDKRLPCDTLFMGFEEDFRFSPRART